MKKKASIAMKRKAKRCVGSSASLDMKKKKAKRCVGGLDKISELPQGLLQHIQYFLSPKEAAQTMILSKEWQHTWSSNYGPDIDLDEYSFEGTEDEFVSLVDKTLQRYHDNKLRINAFELVFSELDSESRVSLLEKWIPIVIHMGIKVFDLKIAGTTSYNLSLSVFEAESIIELSLQGCRLDHDDDKVIMFKHLKVLRLSQVYIEEKIFQRIISSCPLIEVMQLSKCECLGSIQVNKFQVFPNLKYLSLAGVCLSGISLCDDFWCYFPSLKNLKFTGCYGFEEIQILSHSIQHISMTGINRSIKARIDAPNILSFKFSGNYIPATLSFAKTNSSKWKSDIVLQELDIVDDYSLWLKQLSEMLRGGLSQSKISLDLYKLCNHDHQQQQNNIVHFEPPEEVEELRLFDYRKSSAVINDLFSVCRPKNIDACWYTCEYLEFERETNEFTEFVCKILMERSESRSGGIKWQKDLKEVRLNIYDRALDEWHPLDGTSLRKCALPNDECVHGIRFQLKWRGN